MKEIKKLKDLKNKTYLEVFRLLNLDQEKLELLEKIDENFSVISEIEGYNDNNFINFISKQKTIENEDIREQFFKYLDELVKFLKKLNKKYKLNFDL